MSSAPTGRTGKSDGASSDSPKKSSPKKGSKKGRQPQPAVKIGKPLRELIDAGRKSPFLWALSGNEGQGALVSDLELWHSGASQRKLAEEAIDRLEQWLASTIDAGCDEALRALQSLEFLPQLANLRSKLEMRSKTDTTESEMRLIDLSQRIIERAENVAALSTSSMPDDILWQLLTTVELPLAISAVVRRGRSSLGRFDGIREATHRLLDDYCDNDGQPRAGGIDQLRPLVASLVRSAHWARSLKIKLLQHELLGLFDGLVEQMLRFTRLDRSALGNDQRDWSWSKRLVERALELCSDDELPMLSHLACRVGRKENRNYVESLRSASSHSDWAKTSMLRSRWEAKSPKLLVTHDQGRVHLELETVLPILMGEWQLSIDRNGKPLRGEGDWSVVCWHEDDSVAYLELERTYGKETRVQRQILLGREDEFVYLSDVILGTEEATWDYRGELRLADGMHVIPEEETRELRLRGLGPKNEELTAAAIVPLALPEWKLPRTDGNLESSSDKIVHYQHAVGERLYFPLFLDIRSWRATSPLTWRRLTVAEHLSICDPNIAQAFRVQVGWEQWAFYRSLAAPNNRTFMGENLISEFFAGQFDQDEGMNELLRIEEE